jgi:hypothetical protein
MAATRKERVFAPLWIDAVYINQADAEEITDQLKLMSRIYAEASLVII